MEQARHLAKLLDQYQDVFSWNDQDVGKTDLVKHSIPVQEGMCPIRQPTHHLGTQKEQGAERKI